MSDQHPKSFGASALMRVKPTIPSTLAIKEVNTIEGEKSQTKGKIKTVRHYSKGRNEFSSAKDLSNIRIHFARTRKDLDEVYQLTHERYVEMEYCKPHANGRLNHYPHLDFIPETYVLLTKFRGKLVGTVSLTLDGPNGLQVDNDYK